MWCLNRDQQTLLLLPLSAWFLLLVKGKFLEVVVSNVGVLAVTWVVADILFLPFKHFNERVELLLGLLQLMLFLLYFIVLQAKRRRHEFYWVWKFFQGSTHAFFGTTSRVVSSR
jgi:hypothetical protein